MASFSSAASCSDRTLQLRARRAASGRKSIFQWCRKFMKMLFCERFWPQCDGKTPGGHLVMDCMIRPQTHATSVTTREGERRRWRSRTLILIMSASFSLVLSKAWGLSWESVGPSVIFNSLFLTSDDKQHAPPQLLQSPGFYLCWAFEPGLKAAALKQTWPRGIPTPDRMPTNFGISVLPK